MADASSARRPSSDFLRHHFLREGRLAEDQALFILDEAKRVLSQEPNLLTVQGPITSECLLAFRRCLAIMRGLGWKGIALTEIENGKGQEGRFRLGLEAGDIV